MRNMRHRLTLSSASIKGVPYFRLLLGLIACILVWRNIIQVLILVTTRDVHADLEASSLRTGVIPSSAIDLPFSSLGHGEMTHRRIFLGILTTNFFDDKRRIVIRNTYLREGDPNRPIKICSLDELRPDCQVVYSFIGQVKKGRNVKRETDRKNNDLPDKRWNEQIPFSIPVLGRFRFASIDW